jgi:hypothetical protein
MHTRRVGAFLIGAWLLGALLTSFIASQSYTNVDRFFSNPPPQVSKEIDDVGPDVMRQILRFQASQHNRHVFETWEVIQLGILTALLATSFLTSHRSRIVIISTALMIVMVLIAYLQLTPIMNALSRSYDFLPAGAATQERENYNYYSVWYRVMDVFKAIFALLIAGRLLFDRYEWKDKLASDTGSGKGHRRRRRSSSGRSPAVSAGETNREADGDEGGEIAASEAKQD